MNLTKKRWLVLVSSCIINLCIGSIYAWSVFSSPLAEHINALRGTALTAGDLSIVFTVYNAVVPFIVLFGGAIDDRIGPKPLAIIGAVLFGAGTILSGFARSVGMLVVTYGLMCGVGINLCYVCSVSNTVKLFPDRRGLASGLVTATYGLSSVIVSMAASYMIDKSGITRTLTVLGVIYAAAILICAIFQCRVPQGFKPDGYDPTGSVNAGGNDHDENWVEMLHDARFYPMIMLMFCATFFGTMVISQAAPIGRETVGMSATAAAAAVSILAVFNAAGRIGAGTVSDRIGSVNTIVRDESGLLHGYNTDAYGLRYAMETAGISLAGKKTVIFGSGGASLTAQAVARTGGASRVVVISRNGADNYGNLDRHYDAGVLINATPVGMYPNVGGMPADPGLFPECSGIVDMIYNPRRSKLLMRAEELGIPCIDGMPMLAAQAAAAEGYFFGKDVPESEIARVTAIVRQETLNIVLVGMPGSGKTTIGRALSGMTGRRVVDIDAQVEKNSGRTISDIFAEEGEAAFRKMERDEIAGAGKEHGQIIVCGGGAVKDVENYPPLHQNGRIYHIQRDTKLLARRGRPLSMGADMEEMYAQRRPMYEHFRDAEILNDDTPESAAEKIWRDFCENTGN